LPAHRSTNVRSVASAAEQGPAPTVNPRGWPPAFTIPAKAKRGKQKLKLTLTDAGGATVTKSVNMTVI
jgi:hypothetical protein